MSPADIERVFGLGRLKMVTGRHVEVYREEARPGERRRYTKRFLATMDGDFREWTEREWRILARLVGHGVDCVPEVVQFDRGAGGGTALVQTYDAGITVDQWATLLPVQRDGRVLAHVFADRAHWWALARHALMALDSIHRLEVIHLDLKADNVCIPYGPPQFRPQEPGARLQPLFPRLALIDFAFSLVAGEALTTPLPIGRQQDYAYQSPRLLEALEAGGRGDLGPTRQLDWRCDLYSLVAMLGRYLPDAALVGPAPTAAPNEWNAERLVQAQDLLAHIRRCHDAEVATARPHADLIAICTEVLADQALSASLESEWILAVSAAQAPTVSSPTPITRIAPPVRSPVATLLTPLAVGTQVPPAPISFEAGPAPLAGAVEAETAVKAAEAAEPPPVEAALPMAAPAPTTVVLPIAAAATTVDTPVAAAAVTQAPSHDAGRSTFPVEPTSTSLAEPLPADVSPEPHENTISPDRAGTPPPRTRPTGMRRLAYPAVIAALLAAIALFSAGGVWTDLREILNPSTPVRPASKPAPIPAPVVAQPAPQPEPRPVPPPPPPQQQTLPLASDYGERSLQLLAGPIHDAAARTEWALARALALTDQAEQAGDDAEIRQAVIAARLPSLGAEHLQGRVPEDARRLNEQARNALNKRRSVRDALDLQLRAFGANPLDAEVAGNLAYFHLIADPPQPETARRLALHALTLRSGNHPAGRFEDWTNLAVASAMVGRGAEARRAFWMTLAMTGNVEKNCRAALNAAATYGPRVRPPAEAMLARIRDRGQSDASPYCAWPPNWAAGSKFP